MTSRSAVAVLAAALLTSGCSSATTVGSAEAALAEHFLEPLRSEDIGFTVDNTCHLDRSSSPDEPWHLEVQIEVDADPERVADILEAADVVLVRDRDPMLVQQERGAPAHGWNGVLESADEGTLLGLTRNNATPGRSAEAGGWAEVCGEARASARQGQARARGHHGAATAAGRLPGARLACGRCPAGGA